MLILEVGSILFLLLILLFSYTGGRYHAKGNQVQPFEEAILAGLVVLTIISATLLSYWCIVAIVANVLCVFLCLSRAKQIAQLPLDTSVIGRLSGKLLVFFVLITEFAVIYLSWEDYGNYISRLNLQAIHIAVKNHARKHDSKLPELITFEMKTTFPGGSAGKYEGHLLHRPFEPEPKVLVQPISNRKLAYTICSALPDFTIVYCPIIDKGRVLGFRLLTKDRFGECLVDDDDSELKLSDEVFRISEP